MLLESCLSAVDHRSINGEKQDGGFDGVEGEVFPCAGSYRSGVTIRLLKVGQRFAIPRKHLAHESFVQELVLFL